VLSFGTIGCNLGCRFCQNWELSRARDDDRLAAAPEPEAIAALAQRLGCRTVAFTYNDPVVFAEYALGVAQACQAAGVRTVAVTAGYINPGPAAEFFAGLDAANVDLKGFTEAFYARRCDGRLAPVLATLAWLKRETPVWLEVTTLLMPGENDSDDELARAADWFVAELGPDTPWHFSAFHPAHRMVDRPPTPAATLQRARRIAQARGIHFVYTGNVLDPAGASTGCPDCGRRLVRREGYVVTVEQLQGDRCAGCGGLIPGRFDVADPGPEV
jgi:pyruvate formate lyase activating enzyme